MVKQIRNYGRLHWPAKPSAPVTCDRFLPIKCSTERLQQSFSHQACPEPFLCQRKLTRRDANTAKKTLLILLLGVLCPVESSHGRGGSVALVTLFHGASPVEYLLDQDRVVLPKRYSTGENQLSSNLPLFSELGVLCAFARVIVYPIP